MALESGFPFVVPKWVKIQSIGFLGVARALMSQARGNSRNDGRIRVLLAQLDLPGARPGQSCLSGSLPAARPVCETSCVGLAKAHFFSPFFLCLVGHESGRSGETQKKVLRSSKASLLSISICTYALHSTVYTKHQAVCLSGLFRVHFTVVVVVVFRNVFSQQNPIGCSLYVVPIEWACCCRLPTRPRPTSCGCPPRPTECTRNSGTRAAP